jgi:hypothetical protein
MGKSRSYTEILRLDLTPAAEGFRPSLFLPFRVAISRIGTKRDLAASPRIPIPPRRRHYQSMSAGFCKAVLSPAEVGFCRCLI